MIALRRALLHNKFRGWMPVWRSRASQGKPDQARALSERNRALARSRVARAPVFPRSAGYPVINRRFMTGPATGCLSLWVLSLGQARESTSPVKGETRYQTTHEQKTRRPGLVSDTREQSHPASTRCIPTPISAGDRTTVTPAFSSAAILASAVPWLPLMMAPACPMRLPGGAVTPAM